MVATRRNVASITNRYVYQKLFDKNIVKQDKYLPVFYKKIINLLFEESGQSLGEDLLVDVFNSDR